MEKIEVLLKSYILKKKIQQENFKKLLKKKKLHPGVPVVAQWLTNLTSNHEVVCLIPGLAQIRCCHELWSRLQTWLGSGVAVAVAQAGGYSSDQNPSLGTSVCGPRKDKKKKSYILRRTRPRQLHRLFLKICKEYVFQIFFKLSEDMRRKLLLSFLYN